MEGRPAPRISFHHAPVYATARSLLLQSRWRWIARIPREFEAIVNTSGQSHLDTAGGVGGGGAAFLSRGHSRVANNNADEDEQDDDDVQDGGGRRRPPLD